MRTVRAALRNPGTTLALVAAPAGRRAGRLRQVRPWRRVLPQRRAGFRPGDRARPRQHRARGEEQRHRRGREAGAEHQGAFDRLHPRRRAAARLKRDQRGHHRRHSVRILRLEDEGEGPRDHGRHPQGHRRHSRRAGRSCGAARRPPDRQGRAGADRRAEFRTGPRCREEGRRHRRQASRRARHGRRPAAAGHRLEDRGQPGRGREIRRQPQHGRHRDPARHQRRQGHRVPADRQRQGSRHPGAVPGEQAQPRPDRRAAHADAVGLRAAWQLRRARCDAAHRPYQPRSPATA